MKSNPLFKLLKTVLIIPFIFSAYAEEPRFYIPEAPSIAAKAYILMDHNSGIILAANNENEKRSPASLTKLMTSYVVFKRLKEEFITLDDEVKISEKAWRTGGSKSFIEVGKMIKLEDLLKGMIIQSGNDASVALAEHVAGSEGTFVLFMNDYAQQIGMKNSRFENASGLPHDDQYTTAKDIALLSSAMIREFPVYYEWYSQKEFTYNNITQPNRNKLLWRDKSVDGVKTGYTEKAGYCMIASAIREEMRLISVVMGTASANARANESQSLLNYGFRFFETHKLYAGNDALNEARIWKGDSKKLPLGLVDDLFVTIPRRHYNDLKAEVNINKKIIAPVKKGENLGSVNVSLAGDVVANMPLVALKTVSKGGFVDRLYDEAMLMME